MRLYRRPFQDRFSATILVFNDDIIGPTRNWVSIGSSVPGTYPGPSSSYQTVMGCLCVFYRCFGLLGGGISEA